MRARLIVDLSAIVANWRALAALAEPAECGAVLKADAYGLGAARVGPALRAAGCRTFFTALAEEGAALRAALGAGPAIYVLNGFETTDAALVSEAALRPVVNHPAHAQALAAALPGSPCALQVETGMNRLGMEPAALAALPLDRLAPDLLISHLACADDAGDPANRAQRAAFAAVDPAPLRRLRRSLAATGGTLLGPEFRFDLVRPGVGLYGGLPFREAASAVRLEVPVLQVREAAAGAAVGYGASWRAERPTRIATIAAGYADGLPRALSNRGRAFHRGRLLPFAGRVSMDLITLDATGAPDLAPGDRVDLLGPGQTVDDLASAAGTIGYEILTSLGTRYARSYEGG